eukprot:2091172-Alexandrium_andersonii.AAC.1
MSRAVSSDASTAADRSAHQSSRSGGTHTLRSRQTLLPLREKEGNSTQRMQLGGTFTSAEM